jgi:CRP-like cAMP-binding protein
MAKTSPPTKKSSRTPPSRESSDGNRTMRNSILLALPARESAALLPKLEFISLPVSTVLNEYGEVIKFAYFINEGLASVLNVMATGKSVEVGLCGSEGFVGVPLLAGYTSSHMRIIMQVAGAGFRISAKQLIAALQEYPKLTISLNRFAQELALQGTQVAACNRLHEIEERLGRWLLMSQDRLGGNVVPLTQEFLAYMLATRRASVTVAAGILQEAGFISYSRGIVHIEDRKGLEEATCECYGAVNRQTRKWKTEIN